MQTLFSAPHVPEYPQRSFLLFWLLAAFSPIPSSSHFERSGLHLNCRRTPLPQLARPSYIVFGKKSAFPFSLRSLMHLLYLTPIIRCQPWQISFLRRRWSCSRETLAP